MNAPKHDREFEELLRLEPLARKLDELGLSYRLLPEHYVVLAIFVAAWLPFLWMVFGDYIRRWFS